MTVIVLRFVEYVAAAMVFGAPLFLLYSGLDLSWTRRWLLFATLILAAAVPLHFVAQAAYMVGSLSDLDGATLMAVVRETDFGKASLVRGSAVVSLLAANLLLPGRRQYGIITLLGGIICASFSWMGHGAATQGPAGWIHLGGDILHTLAAAAWIGALMVFAPWLMQSDAAPRMLVAALKNFSGFGAVFVATLIVTGLINSWFLVGPSRLPQLWRSLYGELLVAKILLFLAMLWLAMRNRDRHVPRLAEQPSSSAGLRQSILVETGLGVIILALVAFIGMLPPPSSFHA